MTNNNFIKSVEFLKGEKGEKGEENLFPPFKGGDKIYFGGDAKYDEDGKLLELSEMQKIIEFYLKSKGVKNYKKNAERFKINCVLGNNGGGKSRLFDWLYNFFYGLSIEGFAKESEKYSGKINIGKNEIIFNSPYYYYNQEISEEVPIYKNKDFGILLDDFFKLSGNINNSVNKNLLEKGYNNFYIYLNNFILKNKNFYFIKNVKNIELYIKKNSSKYIEEEVFDDNENNELLDFFEFLAKNINNENNIIFNKNNIKKIWLGIFDIFNSFIYTYDFLGYDIDGDFKFQGLESDKFKNFQRLLFIIETFLNSVLEKNNIVKKLKDNLENLNRLIKDIEENLDDFKKGKKHFKDYFSECKGEKDEILFDRLQRSDHAKNSKDLFENLYFSYSDKSFYKNTDEYKKFQEYLGNLNKDDLEIFIDNKIIDDIEIEKILLCKKLFELNLGLDDYIFENLSAGEKTIITRFSNIYIKIIKRFERGKNNFTILIDEPDLHLHLDWQKKYIQKLIDVFSTLNTNIKLHFIIATHSPFIISDLPAESIIVLDGSEKNKYGGEFTEIIDDYEKKFGKKTFGANFVDLINDGFFFEDKVLMGSFAESVIGEIAEKRRNEITNSEEIEDKENVEKIEEQIGDDFLKDNLLYFKSKNND